MRQNNGKRAVDSNPQPLARWLATGEAELAFPRHCERADVNHAAADD